MQCEVWSVKESVGSEKCEVWSFSLECEERSVKCEVWSVKEAVWSVEVWSVECEVWSLECEECSVKCGVWSVKTLLRLSLKKSNGCRGKDTVGIGCLWTIGHLCLGNFRRRLARVYVMCNIYVASVYYIFIYIYILYRIWYTSKDRTKHMHVAFSRSAHLLVIPFPSNPPFHAHISRWINFCRQLLRACLVTRFCHTRHKYIPQSKPTTRPPSADWIGDLRGEATRRTGTSGYHIWLIY